MHRPSALSLSEQINAATRESHTSLNRLILQRLPLALPPHANDSSIYVTGLLHFATIYITFEDLWAQILTPCHNNTDKKSCDSLDFSELEKQRLLNQRNPKSPRKNVATFTQEPRASSRIESILLHLHVPGLSRTERLRADIGNLIHMPKHEVDERINDMLDNSSMSKFLNHIKKNVKQNPHILLAYSWILYMALFSGGRFLRTSLREAGGLGASFWSQDSPTDFQHYDSEEVLKKAGIRSDVSDFGKEPLSTTRLNSKDKKVSRIIPGLHFFYFVGDSDGEDLKIEFKKRMKDAETLLTESERMDIILEGQHIFKYMIGMVWELDALIEKNGRSCENAQDIQESKSLDTKRGNPSLGQTRILQKHQEKPLEQTWRLRFSNLDVKNSISKAITFDMPFYTFKGIFGELILKSRTRIVNKWFIFSKINSIYLNPGSLFLSSLGLMVSLVILSLSYDILDIKIY